MTPEDVKRLFKSNLKKERLERGWTIDGLVEKTGLYRQKLEKCEDYGRFSAISLAALCQAMDVDPWIFFVEEV